MSDYISTLNKEQYEAATTIDGYLFILAGAGSGKTRVLITRTAYMLQNGIKPENILLVTFTNKAANEMKERIKNWIGEPGENVTACTFHSFCSLILRRFYKEAGLSVDFKVLDAADAKSAIQTSINDYLDRSKEKGNVYSNFFKPSLIEQIQSKYINETIPLDQAVSATIECYPEYYGYNREAVEVYQMYSDFKRDNRALDFDDLQLYMYRLLSDNENVRKTIDERFRYISCDEYQDTNKIQNQVLEMLSIDYPNLTVVGDDNQSIYKFRGARIENILEFSKIHPDCKCVVLKQNYRSTQEILDVANAIMEQAEEGIKKDLISADNKHGFKPVLKRLYSESDEPEYILGEIRDNNLDLTKTAIIYRSNYSSSMLEAVLNRENIPYEKRGGMRFNEKKGVKDILATIRLAFDPADEIAAIRVLPLIPGLGGTSARKIAAEMKTFGHGVMSSQKYKKNKFGNDLEGFGAAIQSITEMSLPDCVNTAAQIYVGLRNYALKKSEAKTSEILRQKAEIAEAEEDAEVLKSMAEGYKSVSEFVTDLSLENQRKKEKENCLVLTTIHSAKGLEWDNVFIMDCVEGCIPSSRADREGNVSEELRCLYVAITRAKKRLYVITPESGRNGYSKRSRFINNYNITSSFDQR